MKRIKVKVKEKQKCYRFFIDDCGQGFTSPCCYKVDKDGNIVNQHELDSYYTWVTCKGNVNNCPFVKRILNK